MLIAIISFTSLGVIKSSASFESLYFLVTEFSLTKAAGEASFAGSFADTPTSLQFSGRITETADLSFPRYLFATRFTSDGVTFFMLSI